MSSSIQTHRRLLSAHLKTLSLSRKSVINLSVVNLVGQRSLERLDHRSPCLTSRGVTVSEP